MTAWLAGVTAVRVPALADRAPLLAAREGIAVAVADLHDDLTPDGVSATLTRLGERLGKSRCVVARL